MKTNNELQASVTEIIIADTGIYASATCGKVSAYVCITTHGVDVTCQNASHKCWRGPGRSFQTVADALAAYKKAEMKAIITAVDARNA